MDGAARLEPEEADMSAIDFYRRVMEETGLANRAVVKQGTAAVLRALRDRLTEAEARQLAAQLPRELRRVWEAGAGWGPRPVKLRRQEFYARVRADAALPDARSAREMTRAVFAALKAQVSPGEADDVLAQLPKDLKEVWAQA